MWRLFLREIATSLLSTNLPFLIERGEMVIVVENRLGKLNTNAGQSYLPGLCISFTSAVRVA